ncbi:MAG: hypothetical protein ACD_30C00023G0003 [uncultured bacterium]|uniref:Uncharacterized protein n=3 Tax=Candidatus Daviesiibacteriota TaxID=1752718 RepID=A0A0G0I154_9BACT|nr:MAG: hypothetical protein ACD_30C00023G0003 [uncultured bacterium]KKQ09841.1 MAG: hypothetical protein US19_C0010G0019 [Candidatus Daviesbacteria bacterium GW2011_GWB1_36_5]KKQ16013.1 MAG: hypothetical protein US28_C0006G0008 [Candidatus Daviesbacteria bacterium GW2011_GWA1_36_8]OGE31501.1 MAG: hypothetical protein A3C99_03135 [Candidatus Daviesbacteria bacterium RIFCSPHIGHO2_02_FULL_37_9]OGE36347.1 MAG: hypothetical protein A3E66_05630 [Candidatus Daviesbacteria bacterium RIFCSPHIGHO2_12_FU
MIKQKGIASILIVIIVLIAAAAIGYFIFMAKLNLGTRTESSPTSSNELTLQDYRGTQKDPNDKRYDLVKEKYDLTPEQLEILSRVAEGDR